eukprot:TRINITY_DN66575_c7_g3_i1.p1 TRINITY_DN66575_c7_g3~~TRINITY_DN66575_c7_g3_i1.p1  ORF type:complete len:463 (+),score=28.19 TRINITY_DN66575_c7_g3_i1:38-1426(+)
MPEFDWETKHTEYFLFCWLWVGIIMTGVAAGVLILSSGLAVTLVKGRAGTHRYTTLRICLAQSLAMASLFPSLIMMVQLVGWTEFLALPAVWTALAVATTLVRFSYFGFVLIHLGLPSRHWFPLTNFIVASICSIVNCVVQSGAFINEKTPWQLVAIGCILFPILQIPTILLTGMYAAIHGHYEEFVYDTTYWWPSASLVDPTHVPCRLLQQNLPTNFALCSSNVKGGGPALVKIPPKFYTEKTVLWWWDRYNTAPNGFCALLDPTVPTGTYPGVTINTPWGADVDTYVPAYLWTHWSAVFGTDLLDKLLWWCGGQLTVNDGLLEIPSECASDAAYVANTEPFLFEVAIGEEWHPVDTGSGLDCLIVPHFQFPHLAKDAKQAPSSFFKDRERLQPGAIFVTKTEQPQRIVQEKGQMLTKPLLIRGTTSLPPKYKLRRGQSLDGLLYGKCEVPDHIGMSRAED